MGTKLVPNCVDKERLLFEYWPVVNEKLIVPKDVGEIYILESIPGDCILS
jgi:hypothetical protein